MNVIPRWVDEVAHEHSAAIQDRLSRMPFWMNTRASARQDVVDYWAAGFSEDETRQFICEGFSAQEVLALYRIPAPTSQEASLRLTRSLRGLGRIVLMEINSGAIAIGHRLRRFLKRDH